MDGNIEFNRALDNTNSLSYCGSSPSQNCTQEGYPPMGKNCGFLKKKQSLTIRSYKWETIWESTESVERNVNGLRQTDVRIRLRDKSFRSGDPFDGEK